MSSKEALISILTELLSNKLGNTNYKKFLPLDNLKKVTIEYIQKKLKDQNITLSGLALAQYNILVKQLNNAKSVESFMSILSEKLFNLQGK